jgi:hypothetical protein
MPNVHSGIDGNLTYNLCFEFIDKSIKKLFITWKYKKI